jgi:hypothetical protein
VKTVFFCRFCALLVPDWRSKFGSFRAFQKVRPFVFNNFLGSVVQKNNLFVMFFPAALDGIRLPFLSRARPTLFAAP